MDSNVIPTFAHASPNRHDTPIGVCRCRRDGLASGVSALCRELVGSLSVAPTHLKTTLRDLAAPRGALNLDR